MREAWVKTDQKTVLCDDGEQHSMTHMLGGAPGCVVHTIRMQIKCADTVTCAAVPGFAAAEKTSRKH